MRLMNDTVLTVESYSDSPECVEKCDSNNGRDEAISDLKLENYKANG